MVDRDEDYNTRYGGYAGNPARVQANEVDPEQSGRDRADSDGQGRTRQTVDASGRSLHSSVPPCEPSRKGSSCPRGLPPRKLGTSTSARVKKLEGALRTGIALSGGEYAEYQLGRTGSRESGSGLGIGDSAEFA